MTIPYVKNLTYEQYNAMLLERDAEIAWLRTALKPFAALADRKEYTLDDVPHGLFIDAKLALNKMRVVRGMAKRAGPS